MKYLVHIGAVCMLLVPIRKVLIVTGIDYPGHKWKLTAPVLAKGIAADKRLRVTVTEKPGDLAKDNLSEYDVIVLHFMDWEVPDPGGKARANLERFVREGGGGLSGVARFRQDCRACLESEDARPRSTRQIHREDYQQ